MLSIDLTWQHYFEDHHEGLGTTYERFILHQYFEKIKRKYSVQNIFEAPSFGMTGISGINSMWWAGQGIPVTLMDDDQERLKLIAQVWKDIGFDVELVYGKEFDSLPFANGCFDLSWNFAALGFVRELEEFLKELTRVTRSVIFICLPNRTNLACIIRSRMAESKSRSMNSIHPLYLRKIMGELNWRIEETGYFDVPPWPDIAMKKEDLLRDLGLKWLADRLKSKGNDGLCILNYFSGLNKRMEQEIQKYAFLEHGPPILKKIWAHHQYFIFVPKK